MSIALKFNIAILEKRWLEDYFPFLGMVIFWKDKVLNLGGCTTKEFERLKDGTYMHLQEWCPASHKSSRTWSGMAHLQPVASLGPPCRCSIDATTVDSNLLWKQSTIKAASELILKPLHLATSWTREKPLLSATSPEKVDWTHQNMNYPHFFQFLKLPERTTFK